MKVLQILPELNAGGVERGTLEVAAHLVAKGHESVVVSNGGRLVAQLEQEGSRHITMAVHRKSPRSLLQVLPLRRLFEREQPDIIHYRSRLPGWITWLAWRGMNPATRPRLVSTVHGFYSVNPYSAIMMRGERVIAVSESTRDYIYENYPQTSHDLIRVIPRGVDLSDNSARCRPTDSWLAEWESQHPELVGKYILLLPGRITRLKGHKDFFKLIEALRQQGIPVHGLVVGDTHPQKRFYLEELRSQVHQMRLESEITFLGHRSDIHNVMSVASIVCALSQQPESFGRSVLEALAIGKPVVGYDCGGVGELLTRLFPEGAVPLGDISRLIDTAASVISSQPAPRTVGEPYSLDATLRSTLIVYEELIKTHR